MRLIVRVLLLLAVVVMIQLLFVDKLHKLGSQLAFVSNLPHKSLGALYWAHLLQPEREDYRYDYLTTFLLLDRDERLIEGQTRPVVPMYAVSLAGEYPEDAELQHLRKYIMYQFKKNHHIE